MTAVPGPPEAAEVGRLAATPVPRDAIEWGMRWSADHHGEQRESTTWFDTADQRDRAAHQIRTFIGGTVFATGTRRVTYWPTNWDPMPS